MTAEAAQSILRRKARASHASVGPAAMDVPKALRLAFARAGDAALDIPISVREVATDAVLPESLAATAPEAALMLGLADATGATGLAISCAQCTAAVIEAVTLGAVLPGDAEPRAPTATDAALLKDFLNQVLETFGTLSLEMGHPPPVSGYSVVAPHDDVRVAALSLADVAHRRMRITLDFGLGAKVGELTLVLPAQRTAPVEAVDEGAGWSGALERAVLVTSAELDARLPSIDLPLSKLAALRAGDILPLEGATLDRVRLTAPNGQQVARARLGRCGPFRAVRVMLVEPEDDALGIDTLPMEGGDQGPSLALLPANPDPIAAQAIDAAPLEAPPIGQLGDLPALDASPPSDMIGDVAAAAQPMELDLGEFAPMPAGDLDNGVV